MNSSGGAEGVVVEWREGESIVRWTAASVVIEKDFVPPPEAVVVTANPPGVLIVEALPAGSDRLNNAIVFDPDGTERVRLTPPDVVEEKSWNIGFYTAYNDPEGLVVVFSTTVGDFWGRPNLITGDIPDIKPWR